MEPERIRRINGVGPEKGLLSLSVLKQPVNQWLCIALLGLCLVWFMLYYAKQKAEILGRDLGSNPINYIYEN